MGKHSQSSQNSKFTILLQYLRKEVGGEVNFLLAEKHQSFLKVDFNTLDIKVPYKMIIFTIGHDQALPCLLSSLQYLKKEVSDGVHFLHLDNTFGYQSF